MGESDRKWYRRAVAQVVPDKDSPGFLGVLDKFSLIIESKSIPEEYYGEWFRKNDHHSENLTLWEQELAQNTSSKAVGVEKLQNDYKKLQSDYKKIEKERNQNKDALSEMSALYALSKNGLTF